MKKKLQNLMGIVFVMLTLMTNIEANTCVSETITLDSNVSSTWSADCNSTHRVGSYAKYYTFTLASDENISIDLTSNIDTYLFLLSDTNQSSVPLTEDDDGGDGSNSRIFMTLSAGTYTIEATTFNSSQIGDFTVSLNTAIIVDMHFYGTVTLPTSLLDLYSSCSGNTCPSLSLQVEVPNNTWVNTNITYNTTSSEYDYNLTFQQVQPSLESNNNYKILIHISNGDMGEEDIYYSFGVDNAIGNPSGIVDGDDIVLHNRFDNNGNDIFMPLNIPLSQTNVNVNIDLTNKNVA